MIVFDIFINNFAIMLAVIFSKYIHFFGKLRRLRSSVLESIAVKLQDAKYLDYSSQAVRNTAWHTVKYDSHKFLRVTNFYQCPFFSLFFFLFFSSFFSDKSRIFDAFLNFFIWKRMHANSQVTIRSNFYHNHMFLYTH